MHHCAKENEFRHLLQLQREEMSEAFFRIVPKPFALREDPHFGLDDESNGFLNPSCKREAAFVNKSKKKLFVIAGKQC